ncbi:LysM peptidoglycan-binding domain-containing protein [Fructilactobacillus sp. Tb1]|uniref:LysM peptidoglycan-binding domain-containing protein n=1 Tax=Fructilactobacillus sp. Tb1 TaxID=3422304 RepID=UPI003D26824A
MKFTKSLAAMAAISAGMMFAGAAHVDANSTVKHTVQTGDTISGLSKQYKVSQKKLSKANKNKDINTIYVGEIFVFDGKGNVKVDKKSAKAPVKSAQNNTAASNDNNTPATNNNDAQAATSTNNAASQSKAVASTTTSSAATTQKAAPVAKAAVAAPVQQAATYSAPAASSAPVASNASLAGIAQGESGNDYNARNGQYIGKYQLSASYLNGDYSPANQERVAQQYAVSRYGSVAAAAAYHAAHGSW